MSRDAQITGVCTGFYLGEAQFYINITVNGTPEDMVPRA